MRSIALCNCPNSRQLIEERIVAFFGALAEYECFEYKTLDALIADGIKFDLIFINKNLIESIDTLIKHITRETEQKSRAKTNEPHSFINYIDDPISDEDCDKAVEHIRLHLGYTSMYLAAELLTDKGLRSIAISKILFFEFFNRKIRIKTQSNEYFCFDTLRNIISLFGKHDFYQVHKGFIVNLKHVAKVKNYTITMCDGSIVPLAQKKSSDFRKTYSNYLEQHNTQVKLRNAKNRKPE
jgi:DNA-binding LytR/AlgR family response regulator